MTENQYIKICQWQKETFGHATAQSKLYHLKEELEELMSELQNDKDQDSTKRNHSIDNEFADCFIILFGAAGSYGYRFEHIVKLIANKMDVNKRRKWGEPDENGVVNHIKD